MALIARIHPAGETELEALRKATLGKLLERFGGGRNIGVADVVEVLHAQAERLGSNADHEAEVYELMVEHFDLTAPLYNVD